MDTNDQRISALEERLANLEERMNEGRRRRETQRRIGGDDGPHRRRRGHEGPREHRGHAGEHGRHFGRGSMRRLIAKADDLEARGIMSFAGLHRTERGEGEGIYMWGLRGVTTDDVLAVDDARNIKVLSALAHPVRLRMMKSILQQPGTAAQLRERLELTSNGQTYHALNMLENGGMIEQQSNGTYTPVGDKAAGFLIVLGGLFQLTEGDYSPAFLDIELKDLEDEAEDDSVDDDTRSIEASTSD